MNDIRNLTDCGTIYAEYWTHVSSQAELPLADASWRTRTLGQVDAFVLKATDKTNAHSSESIEASIAEALFDEPSSLHEFRLIASLSDKRLYLDLSYVFSRTLDPVDPNRTLCGCAPHELTRHSASFFENLLTPRRTVDPVRDARRKATAKTIARYLTERGVGEVLELYASLSQDARLAVLEKWLMPKETQQNEAKRRGHGAEAQIARVLKELGVATYPPNKDSNPMGAYDPNISLEDFTVVPRQPGSTFSVDIVLLDTDGLPRVCIMSLVQSSDPGQFGVNKSDEIVSLRKRIDNHNRAGGHPVELWGLVDGVGYSENKAGTVDKMLDNFHYFVQVKSAYKAGLRAHFLGLTDVRSVVLNEEFYSPATAQQMVERYVPDSVQVESDQDAAEGKRVVAGQGALWL